MTARCVPEAEIDFTKLIKAGDTVIWTQGAGEPLTLVEKLLAQRHSIGRFNIFLGASYSGLVRPEHADSITFIGLGGVGHNRTLCKAGLMQIIPCHLSELSRLLTDGSIPIDVVFMQLSSANEAGRMSLGAVNGYVQAAIMRARVVVGEVNTCAPWTHSREPLDHDRFDFLVDTSRPLIEVSEKAPSHTDRTIANNIAQLIEDESVLQIGIGTIPNAVLSALAGHKNLGLHTGVVGDGIIDLIEAGVINNSKKPIDSGQSVTGGLVGTKRIYDFANRNSQITIEPVTYTHNSHVLSQLDRFVAVNSAIEVDVTGQVGAEIAGQHYVGTIGGQIDFARGAQNAARGRSIIGLPARTDSGKSKIVSKMRSGVVTTPRADADFVVTEYGTAALRGKSIAERVRQMIAIAHEDDREALYREARESVIGG